MLDMKDSRLNLVFNSEIRQSAESNSTFDIGVLRIAYWGYSRNNTYISKEAFEAAVPSMYNCPVVCNYNRETDMIGSHDMEVVKCVSGNMKLVNLTSPVGVVPESAQYTWETVEEENGDVHEYMCVPVLIWKRQEAYSHIKDNGITSESMEIKILEGTRKDDGITYIDKFEFTAFCLLESAEPCFESAAVEMFSLSEFKEQYALMMEDLKSEMNKVYSANADDINALEHADDYSKGGNASLDMNTLMLKYEITESDINFELEGLSLEEIEAKFAEIQAAKNAEFEAEDNENHEADPANEPEAHDLGSEPEEDDGDDDIIKPSNFSLTNEQFMRELIDAFAGITFVDGDWGEMRRYGYIDHDIEADEVYVHDFADFKVYGFRYSMNGDRVVVDFESKTRKKITFVDFDMGADDNGYTEMFSAYDCKFVGMAAELEALKAFKLSVDEKEISAKRDAIFANFSDLSEEQSFIDLKENCADYSLEELEEKCFAIRGRTQTRNFSRENASGTIRVPVEQHKQFAPDEPYNGLFHEFGLGK